MPPRKQSKTTIIPPPNLIDVSSTPTKVIPSGPTGPRTPNKIAAFALADKRRVIPTATTTGAIGGGVAGGSGGTPGRIVSGSFVMGGNGMIAPPLVVESQRYEEWMKLSTDNKITSTNTWNLALIDYFADMSLLRNGDGDNSINFQKASCTLDGCVKIWTSRVDSVATETGKLLSGLAEDGRSGSREDDEEDIEDGDDEAQEARANKRKAARVASTLADNFSKIKVKAFDLEFTVDPLFKKTSADFDEGGAGGILMNHLGCDGNMKVVFDAGDAKLENNEEDGEEESDEEEEEVGAKLDITNLKRQFLPSLSSFSRKLLCPTLASFRFSPDAVLELDLINPIDVEITKKPATSQPKNAHLGGDQDDDMGGGGDMMDDYGGGGGGVDDWETGAADGGEDFFSETGGNAIGGSSTHFANSATFGNNNNYDNAPGGNGNGNGAGLMEDRDLLMTMDGNGEQTFDFFDSSMATNGGLGNKNWTGPEHWKMSRKVVRKEDATATAKVRKEKIAFSLDFTLPPPLSQKALFASGGPSTTLPRRIVAAPTSRSNSRRSSRPVNTVKEEDFTLPADFQFSSQVLLRLFLKPKTLLKMRRRIGGGMNAPLMMEMTGEGQSDAQFWASNANNHTGNSGMGSMGDDDMGGMGDFFPEDDDGFIPFGTQAIFPDEDDEVPYFSENEDPDGPDDIRTTTEGLQRARPETVNHAKRATRVDVRRLKDSIWDELQVVTIPVKEFPKEAAYVYPSPNEPDYEPPSSEALVPVITGLRKLYPKDKMDEISTSFCFICLLHLANEKGLRIQTPAAAEGSLDDGLLPRASVGGLEQLRVFRELTT